MSNELTDNYKMLETNRILRGCNLHKDTVFRKVNAILIDMVKEHLSTGISAVIEQMIDVDIFLMEALPEYAKINFNKYNIIKASKKNKAIKLCRDFLEERGLSKLSPNKVSSIYGIQAMFNVGRPVIITPSDIDKNFKDWISWYCKTREIVSKELKLDMTLRYGKPYNKECVKVDRGQNLELFTYYDLWASESDYYVIDNDINVIRVDLNNFSDSLTY